MLIGGLELKNRLFLAPLAGVTDLAVREFFSALGAALTHTEMISCEGLTRDNEKTFDMLKTSETEAPLIIQLFAKNEKVLVSGAEKALKVCKRFSGFGINMACPMPKITKNGCGSALLKKNDTASKMVQELKKFGLPVWVKIRKLENDSDTLNFIENLLSSGADNVCIHGRTPSQRYEGFADKSITKLSAERFPNFISASGDVKTVNDIRGYLNMGCVSVMLARGIIGDPFLFEEFYGVSKSYNERVEILINFAEHTKKISGEHRSLVLMKRFVPAMLKFREGSAEKRNSVCTAERLDEVINILKGEKLENV